MSSILASIKKDLALLDIKPKKSLGQNFLINENVYKKIISALDLKSGETVVEIGPGLGILTEYLLKALPTPGVKNALTPGTTKIIALEKDNKLAKFLKNKFKNNLKIEIINEDIMKFNIVSSHPKIAVYQIVGNIPYYLTSRLIRTIFEKWPTPKKIVFMVQKEVAQRITAKPPNMSLLGISVQYYAESEIVSYVKKESFWPAPKVDSAIIKLTPHTQAATNKKAGEHEQRDIKGFFRVVKAGFSSPRKQLVNNLSKWLKVSKTEIGEELKYAGVDTKRRAETLTVEEWEKIAKKIYDL